MCNSYLFVYTFLHYTLFFVSKSCTWLVRDFLQWFMNLALLSYSLLYNDDTLINPIRNLDSFIKIIFNCYLNYNLSNNFFIIFRLQFVVSERILIFPILTVPIVCNSKSICSRKISFFNYRRERERERDKDYYFLRFEHFILFAIYHEKEGFPLQRLFERKQPINFSEISFPFADLPRHHITQ